MDNLICSLRNKDGEVIFYIDSTEHDEEEYLKLVEFGDGYKCIKFFRNLSSVTDDVKKELESGTLITNNILVIE